LAAIETRHFAQATGGGALLCADESVIDHAWPRLREAALRRVNAPTNLLPSSGLSEERREVELDRRKKRLETKANYEKPSEQAAPSRFDVAKICCRLSNCPMDSAKEGWP